MDKKETNRLPDFIKPSHYNITIEPSQDMNLYKGSVQIKATIEKPTNNIVLNAKSIEIKTATICIGTQCLLPKLKKDDESETIVLENPKPIKGDIEINIEFSGIISEDLAGIYKSTYEHKGKEEYLITTQCEAPYARRVFPCFDEPDKKATFDLTVIINKNLKAVSNMLPKSESIENEKKKIQFKTTPKMSTYLFYLGIGDFEFAETNYENIKIRVVTTPGKTKNAKFALDHTKKYLKYFQDYSEIKYPLEKLDLIAIPDFAAGAMENWGAITFRELILLIDEKTTSEGIKKRSLETLAHELWHQWSGNLVTMNWWNDLWLNESFATYMAFKALDFYNPEWKIWNYYLSDDLAVGLFKDSLKTTHPIEVEINSPEEIEEIFDEISYQKGGSVLRMLENYIGEEYFRKGVSNYLKKYSYLNASASDLWGSLNELDKNVKKIMKYWISEPGHPLITLEKTKEGLKISQERYNKKTDQIWPIPISLITKKMSNTLLLEKKSETYPIKEQDIKANHEHFGVYRTKYSQELLNNLGSKVFKKELGEQNRWGINNDLWALCVINEESLKNYLLFLENYTNESSYNILSDIYSNIKKIDRLYHFENWWPKVKIKIVEIMLQTYKWNLQRLGWIKIQNEPIENTLMRNLCISFCSFSEDKEVIDKAKIIYNKKEVSLDLANSIYSVIAQNGKEKEFNEMLDRYEKSKELENKIKLLAGLYQFKDENLLKLALDIALTEKVRTQNLRYVFGNLISNPVTKKIILNWSIENWDKLKVYQDSHYIFQDFLDCLIISQVKESAKIEIKEFLDKNKVKYEMTKANAFEILDMNINFIEKNKEFLKNS